MSEVKYSIAVIRGKLANADNHNLGYQRFSIAEMKSISSGLSNSEAAIEALQQKLESVLAENARMHSAIDQTIGWQESVDPENGESVRLLVDLKTPATDALLNEVRAEGVEIFSAHHKAAADKYGSTLSREISIAAKVYANRLRAAVIEANKKAGD